MVMLELYGMPGAGPLFVVPELLDSVHNVHTSMCNRTGALSPKIQYFNRLTL